MQRELPRKRVRDCYTFILQDLQIWSVCRQSLRLAYSEPPPFAQGRLFIGTVQGGLGFGGDVHKGVLQSLCRLQNEKKPFSIEKGFLFLLLETTRFRDTRLDRVLILRNQLRGFPGQYVL